MADLSGTRVLVLAADLFEDMELLYPVARLQEEGVAVTVAGLDDQPVHGKKGYGPLAVDTTVDNVAAADFEALVIPGGFAPDKLRRSETVLDLVRTFDTAGKPIAFICHAGWVPISAKILKGRRATSVGAIRDDMENAGVHWLDEPVVVDANLISSRTPADLGPWMKALIAARARGRRRRRRLTVARPRVSLRVRTRPEPLLPGDRAFGMVGAEMTALVVLPEDPPGREGEEKGGRAGDATPGGGQGAQRGDGRPSEVRGPTGRAGLDQLRQALGHVAGVHRLEREMRRHGEDSPAEEAIEKVVELGGPLDRPAGGRRFDHLLGGVLGAVVGETHGVDADDRDVDDMRAGRLGRRHHVDRSLHLDGP